VSRGSLAREQENPEVRGGVGIANQSGSIIFSREFTTSSSSYPSLITQPTTVTTGYREEYPPVIFHPLQFPDKLLHYPQNLVTVKLFSSPILFATEIHFPLILLHDQGYPKVCPDSLNLPNAGNSFTGISSLPSYSLFSPTRDLIALI
jgi:hypothetical protein